MSEEHSAEFENQTTETDDTPDARVDTVNSKLLETLTSLTDEVKSLKAQQFQQAQLLQRAAEPAKREELTKEQLQAFQANPALLSGYLESKVREAKQEIETTSKKTVFDQRAYEEFPALKSSKQFQDAVVATMNELVAHDGYTRESPMLLMRAAQLTAGKMNIKPGAPERKAAPTSEEPSRPRPQVKQAKIGDDDPRVVMASLLGISDPKKVEKFKSGLTPYVAPEGKKGRTLTRG